MTLLVTFIIADFIIAAGLGLYARRAALHPRERKSHHAPPSSQP